MSAVNNKHRTKVCPGGGHGDPQSHSVFLFSLKTLQCDILGMSKVSGLNPFQASVTLPYQSGTSLSLYCKLIYNNNNSQN